MRKFVYICGILSMILLPIGVPGKVFAESNVPTVMDGLVNHISDVYPIILSENEETKKAGISTSTMVSIKTNMRNIYKQSQKWKNFFEGTLLQTRSQIVDYDQPFENSYTEIQQLVKTDNKQRTLQLLQNLQEDLCVRKKKMSDFITHVGVFKSEMLEYSRKLKSDVNLIDSRMKMYRTEIRNLEYRLESESLAEDRERIAEEMMVPSALLYDTLEPLYNHLIFVIQDIEGINDGRLLIGWQVSLEDILMTWDTLDSMLANIIDQVNHAAQLNTTFMKARLQSAYNLWKSEIIGKLKV